MKISKIDDASLQMIQQYQKADKADKVEDRASEKAAASKSRTRGKSESFHHGKRRSEPE